MFEIAFALAMTGAAQIAPANVSLVDQLNCTPFEWKSVDGHERGAVTVPVTVNGETRDFQLDTAAEVSVLYGRDGGVHSATAGGMEIPPMYFMGRPQADSEGGTLGLDAMVGRVAVIDYPAKRFCLMAQADFPYSIYRRTQWVDASVTKGRVRVPVTINDRIETNFFFDTGSSLFHLAVDLDRWGDLTGRATTGEATEVVEAHAWGRPTRVVGAPLNGDFLIGAHEVDGALAWVREDAPDFIAQSQEGAEGIIGNAAVWDRVVVLYLGSRPRFGIVADEPTGGPPSGT